MIRKLFILALVMTSSSLSASQLNDYGAIAFAIAEGSGLRVVFDMSHCQTDYPMKIEAVGSITVKDAMVIKNKYITFSNLHFTLNEPRFKGKAVYESSKFILNTDNQMSLDISVLDAKTFDELGEQTHISCPLNQGVHFYTSN